MGSHKVSALRVSQPLGDFYVCVLPASILLQVCYSNPLTLKKVDQSGAYDLEGSQRRLDLARLRAIGRYLATSEAAVPNAIILAANYSADGKIIEDENRRWRVATIASVPSAAVVASAETADQGPVPAESPDSNLVTLEFPLDERVCAVVDGQHRLFGFHEAPVAAREMQLLCSVYLDLPNPIQASLFATINFNQKPVSKSQTYELYGFNLDEEPEESWSPEKLGVFITRKLNSETDSPLFGRVIVAAQDEASLANAARLRKLTWSITTATAVEGVISLFSSNPKWDRDEIHKQSLHEGRSRKKLFGAREDQSPCRELFLNVQDALIYGMVKNFLTAANDVLWKGDNPGFIRKTIGFQALFDLLRLSCPRYLEAKDLRVQVWRELLLPAASINFRDNYFSASGTGRGRVRDTLLAASGLRSADEFREDVASELRRLGALR